MLRSCLNTINTWLAEKHTANANKEAKLSAPPTPSQKQEKTPKKNFSDRLKAVNYTGEVPDSFCDCIYGDTLNNPVCLSVSNERVIDLVFYEAHVKTAEKALFPDQMPKLPDDFNVEAIKLVIEELGKEAKTNESKIQLLIRQIKQFELQETLLQQMESFVSSIENIEALTKELAEVTNPLDARAIEKLADELELTSAEKKQWIENHFASHKKDILNIKLKLINEICTFIENTGKVINNEPAMWVENIKQDAFEKEESKRKILKPYSDLLDKYIKETSNQPSLVNLLTCRSITTNSCISFFGPNLSPLTIRKNDKNNSPINQP